MLQSQKKAWNIKNNSVYFSEFFEDIKNSWNIFPRNINNFVVWEACVRFENADSV